MFIPIPKLCAVCGPPSSLIVLLKNYTFAKIIVHIVHKEARHVWICARRAAHVETPTRDAKSVSHPQLVLTYNGLKAAGRRLLVALEDGAVHNGVVQGRLLQHVFHHLKTIPHSSATGTADEADGSTVSRGTKITRICARVALREPRGLEDHTLDAGFQAHANEYLLHPLAVLRVVAATSKRDAAGLS